MANYNATEVTKATKRMKLTWHGVPTLVRLDPKDAEKVEVVKGDTVEVSNERAEQLLHYSPDWTLEGDKPLPQSKPSKKEEPKGEGNADEEDEKPVGKMTKAECIAAAEKRGIPAFAADAKLADMRAAIVAHDDQKGASTEDDGAGDEESDEE